MTKHIKLQKDYTASCLYYQIKLPLDIEKNIPSDDSGRPEPLTPAKSFFSFPHPYFFSFLFCVRSRNICDSGNTLYFNTHSPFAAVSFCGMFFPSRQMPEHISDLLFAELLFQIPKLSAAGDNFQLTVGKFQSCLEGNTLRVIADFHFLGLHLL